MSQAELAEPLVDGDQQEPISDSETGAEKDKKKGSETREYLVFQEGNSGNWAEFGHAVAANADAAIKSVSPKEGVRYAACPARNWSVAKPSVKVETTTTLVFE